MRFKAKMTKPSEAYRVLPDTLKVDFSVTPTN